MWLMLGLMVDVEKLGVFVRIVVEDENVFDIFLELIMLVLDLCFKLEF